MTNPRKMPSHNRFKIAALALPPQERLFEFDFKDFDEFMGNDKVMKAIELRPDFHRISMLPATRSWTTDYGRKTKTFYTGILEYNKGHQWYVFGSFDKDVEEMSRFGDKDTHYEVRRWFSEM